jgi:hypothetical protein
LRSALMARTDIGMSPCPADEHDWQRLAGRSEPALQLEAVQARHRLSSTRHPSVFDRSPRGTPPRTRTSRRSSHPRATRARAPAARRDRRRRGR